MVLPIPASVYAVTDTFRYTNVFTDGSCHGLFFEAEPQSGRSFITGTTITIDGGSTAGTY